MRFEWHYEGPPLKLAAFLKQQGFSRAQLKKLRYQGGFIFVNKRQRHTAYSLRNGDRILVQTAPEQAAASVVPYEHEFPICYEDDDYLVVNKPAGVASIPAVGRRNDSMANMVKAYLIKTHAESQAVHVVTRLDRDTSGLMVFAKHSLAHSLLDRQLHSENFLKQYLALVRSKSLLSAHGWIILPIGVSTGFYMRRVVSETGKPSVTEYQTLAQNSHAAAVLVTLHTGRTHQIRVHFAAIGHPLFGDDLYNRQADDFKRQALHCAHLRFWQPLQKQWLDLHAPLPTDMAKLSDHLHLPVVY
ncbi:RluA family pseudouridine synthase [Lacticaseibacillus rhamnosus]|uniref:RluA family pseudouridine synthase n=1 Tax=Lacticaseibacillus rhamnosus TaxID=47715 RepID=UPI0022E0BD7F|nr:RluA family pseudouridine synthase [Lacticaseibacillus rhamnosus]